MVIMGFRQIILYSCKNVLPVDSPMVLHNKFISSILILPFLITLATFNTESFLSANFLIVTAFCSLLAAFVAIDPFSLV